MLLMLLILLMLLTLPIRLEAPIGILLLEAPNMFEVGALLLIPKVALLIFMKPACAED